jgi:hypothetical protein
MTVDHHYDPKVPLTGVKLHEIQICAVTLLQQPLDFRVGPGDRLRVGAVLG